MPALITRPDAVSRPTPGRTIVGVLLVTVGLQLFLRVAFGVHLTLWILALGGIVLQRWFSDRRFPALVFGGVLVGVGLGAVVKDIVPGRGIDDFFGFLGWAFGFLLVAALGGRRTAWAYVVAAVFGAAALGSLGLAIGSLLPDKLASVSFPLLVLVAGVLLLTKGHTRPRVVVVLFGAGCLLLASSVSDSYREIRDTNEGPVAAAPIRFPALDGRRLVIETEGSVNIETGPVLRGTAQVAGGEPVRAEVDSGRVTLEGVDGVRSYDIVVPRGTEIEVRSESDIRVSGPLDFADLHTTDSDIWVSGAIDRLEADTNNGDIRGALAFVGHDREANIEVDNGSVDLRIDGDPEIEVEADEGSIRYDGVAEGDEFESDGGDGSLNIETENGTVTITPVERVAVGLN